VGGEKPCFFFTWYRPIGPRYENGKAARVFQVVAYEAGYLDGGPRGTPVSTIEVKDPIVGKRGERRGEGHGHAVATLTGPRETQHGLNGFRKGARSKRVFLDNRGEVFEKDAVLPVEGGKNFRVAWAGRRFQFNAKEVGKFSANLPAGDPGATKIAMQTGRD